MDDNEIAFRFLDVDGKVIEMASGFNSIKEMSEAIVKSKTFLLESGDSIEFKGSDKEVEDEDFLFPEGTSKEAKRHGYISNLCWQTMTPQNQKAKSNPTVRRAA